MIKAISPEEVTDHPWGNQSYHSKEHAQWLADEIIPKLNQQLKLGKTKIAIKNDLQEFKLCESLVCAAFIASVWKVSVSYPNPELGDTIFKFNKK